MMSERFFTSDLHFGHKYVAALRGWGRIETGPDGNRQIIQDADDVFRHDQTLIFNWNTLVGDQDHVYVLGDFSLKSPPVINQWLLQLNGHKHLIWGNHDKGFGGDRQSYKWVKQYLDAGFESIQSYLRLKIDGNQVMLSHFPYDGDHTEGDRYEEYRLRDCKMPLLHGHTHSSQKVSVSEAGTLQIHVGVDSWDLKPVAEHMIKFAFQYWDESGG